MSVVARLVSTAMGVACGVVASRVADVLPARLGAEPPAPAAMRRARLVVAIAVCGASAFVASSTDASSLRVAVTVAFTGMLVAAAAIDLEHMILPNALTFGGALAALATAPVLGGSGALLRSTLGAVLGLVATLAPHVLYRAVRKRSGVGLGDAKLLVFVGAWLGVVGVLVALFLGAVAMIACALLFRVARVRVEAPRSVRAEIDALRARADRGDAEARAELEDDPMASPVEDGVLTTRLPFGPFLSLGALVAALAPETVTRALAWVAGP